MFSIGEFARLSNVSVKMLRHYDAIGLLRPAKVEPLTGYRYYTAAQVFDVARVVALRDLGFRLDEIAALTRDGVAESAYEAREQQLRQSISASQAKLRRLTASRRTRSQVQVKAVPQVLVAIAPDRDFAALERKVTGARADGPPLTLIGPDVVAAVPVRHTIPGPPPTRTLPPVQYMACYVHLGGYDGLAAAWQDLLAWVVHAGGEPGTDLREVYLGFSAEPGLRLRGDYLTDSPAGLVTELQIPMNF